jgi:hypothetical protein
MAPPVDAPSFGGGGRREGFLLSWVTLTLAAFSPHAGQGRVYSAELRAALSQEPEAWLHRRVLVRGVASAMPRAVQTPTRRALCPPPQFSQGDPNPAAAGDQLGLTWACAGASPFLTSPRRIPLIGDLVPAPHVAQWDASAVYRVQLQVECPCGRACFEALLLAGCWTGPTMSGSVAARHRRSRRGHAAAAHRGSVEPPAGLRAPRTRAGWSGARATSGRRGYRGHLPRPARLRDRQR